MRKLIFILIIAGCVAIGYLPQSTTGLLAIALSFLSFALGLKRNTTSLNTLRIKSNERRNSLSSSSLCGCVCDYLFY